ncbi:MAG: thiosulfate oxidation carrier protein SoxY [Granulosicoccus sp.]
MSFNVDSPMTEDDHVVSVMLLASDNPSPEVATFHFTPASGIAKASTRMRLAKTQDVVAVAKNQFRATVQGQQKYQSHHWRLWRLIPIQLHRFNS